jgi:hypothetical protein
MSSLRVLPGKMVAVACLFSLGLTPILSQTAGVTVV